MTESSPPADPNQNAPAPRPRRWGRRIRLTIIALLTLLIASRLVLVLLLPPVLNHVAGYYGLSASYERLELSLLSGDTGLWHLVIRPKTGGDPIMVVDYCRGDVSTLNLLRGRLVVWRVEADGVNFAIDRNADGSLPLLKLIARNTPASTQPTPAAAAKTQTASRFDLTPPLRLDALRLSHIKVHLRDKSTSPTLDSVIGVDVRLSDLGGPSGRPTYFTADVDADPFLDALHLTGQGGTQAGTLHATFAADVNGLRLRTLAPYLAAVGFRPMANETTVHATGGLTLGPSPADPNVAAGSLVLDHVALLADGEEAAAFDHLAVDAPSLDPHRIGLRSFVLDNTRLTGRRTAGGNIRFAGLEYVGVPRGGVPTVAPASTATAAAPAAAPPAVPQTAAPPAKLPIIDLPLADIHHLTARFHDDAVSPPADVSILLDDLAVKQIVLDPAHPDAGVSIHGVAHLPGIAGNVRLDGSVKPMAATKSLAMSVAAGAITLDAVRPYLHALGITPTLDNASFTADLAADATPTAAGIDLGASLSHVKLSQTADLLAMDHVRVTHARIGPGLRVADISIAGPTLAVVHQADGSITAAGFHFDPKEVASVAPASAPIVATHPPAPASAPVSPDPVIPHLPDVAIDHFRWDGIDIAYDDLAAVPPLHTWIVDAGIDYQDTQFVARARVPQVVEQLAIRGSIQPRAQGFAGHVNLSGSGIDATIARPFLRPFHLEPTLRDGALNATADARVTFLSDEIGGSLKATAVSYRDGPAELAGVDEFSVESLRLSPAGVRIGKLDLEHPRLTVTRQSDGVFAAAGLRLLPTPPAADTTGAASSAAFSTSARPAQASPASSTFGLMLAQLHVAGGSLRFVDQLKSTDTTATADLDVQHVLTDGGTPAQIALRASVSGVVAQATVVGTVVPSPDSPAVDLTLAASGLQAGQLAAYLPAGVAVPLRDGAMHARLQAAVAPAAGGGRSAKLIVTDLDYRQPADPSPLLKLEDARVVATRIDPSANVFSLSDVSTHGVECSASRTRTGGWSALGVELGAPTGPATTQTSAPAASATFPATPTVTPSTPLSVQALIAQGRQRPLKIQLDHLDLNVRQAVLTDETRPAAAPLVVENFRLHNLDPIDWGGIDPDSKPLSHLDLDAAVLPAVGSLKVKISTSPLASQSTVAVDLLAGGISGPGIAALLPELQPRLDARALQAGELRLHADTTLRLTRRDESRIDLGGPIDADVEIKPMAFRATPGGPILAGVDEVHTDGVHFQPRTGDVHVKTLEITNPIGRLTQEQDGVHFLGVVLKSTRPTVQPLAAGPLTHAAQQAVSAEHPGPLRHATPVSASTTAPSRPRPPVRRTRPAAEIRVDRLVVSDLDFLAQDNTVNPPLVIPLNSLDLEVRDFTNLAPFEDRTLKFKAVVNAGKVRLPKALAGGGLGGALGDAASLLGGKKVETARQYEDRELFSEASADGAIGLYPAPTGYVKTSLGGFELASLSSTAARYGITLSDGVFDSAVDATLPGDGSIRTKSKFVITDLAVSEPPDGPIFRYLHLPAPLDAVVGVLQDQEGSITIPLNVPLKNGTLSATALAGPAVGAFGSIVATAIASTPFKAASGLTDLLGIGGKKLSAPQPPVLISFDPGDVALGTAGRVAVAQLRDRLIKDPSLTLVIKHVLGGGDVSDARLRANPSPQEARQLAEQMRQQQLVTAQLRSNLAGVLRSDLERGVPADQTLAQLRQVDQQMADTETAMDHLFDMLRPGADRLAPRRTRAVCLDYGKRRIAAVQSLLLDDAPPDLADRIHTLSPQYAQPPGDSGGTLQIQLIDSKR